MDPFMKGNFKIIGLKVMEIIRLWVERDMLDNTRTIGCMGKE